MNVIEITVQRRTGDRVPVVVEYRQSGGLPVRNEGRLELVEEVLRAKVTPLDYGRALGQALFRDDVRDAFARALAQAGDRLHVLLFVEDEKLSSWHWERLCAPLDGVWDFLSLNQRTPFSLYLPSITDRRFPPIGRRDLRALIVAASPADLEQRYGLKDFDVGKVVAGVRAGLGEIPHAVLADVAAVPDAVGPPTLDALAERLTAEPITLLHFVCHGRTTDKGETVIYLADAENRAAPVSASQLIERLCRLEGARGLPRFAFLSTCESAPPEAERALGGLGQRLVRDLGMPAVVAMTQKVSVATADALAAAFYPRLREHGEPDLALVQAGAALAGRYDITVPALYSRLGGLPLFSDALDRELTPSEIEYGLQRLGELLPVRAPVMTEKFDKEAGTLRGLLAVDVSALSQEARAARAQALAEINSRSVEALDLSFNALALGQELPAYDARCPFQGLPAFGYEQRAFFFGRDQLIARLRERLAGHNFLAVHGPSGSGKSSLVVAGLIPPLEQQHPGLRWSVIKPGDDVSQAEMLRMAGHSVENPKSLLVIDQLEELFTLTTDAKQRQAFIDRLLAVARTQLVVLTMRDEFWGECAFYPALTTEMKAHREFVSPMDLAELRSAMEQQAQSVGLRFEADLANTILDDVAGEPGAMPLLQHTLLELWKRRHGRWLRADEYRNLGTVRQAIARTADGIYDQATAADKRRIRDIFLRLTRLDEDAVADTERRDTRRRVPFADLVPAGADPEPTRLLVKELADARLVVTGVNAATGQEEVEVAHEALIRYWKRLEGWLNEDRDAQQLRQALGDDAQAWHRGGEVEELLPRWNARLVEAQVLAHRGNLVLSNLEQEYLDAAITLRDREMADEERRQQEKLEAAQKLVNQQRRWLKRVIALGLIAILAATAAIGFGITSRNNANLADQQRNTAVAASKAEAEQKATAQAASTEAVGQRNVAVNSQATAEALRKVAEEQRNLAFAQQLAAIGDLKLLSADLVEAQVGALLVIESLNRVSNTLQTVQGLRSWASVLDYYPPLEKTLHFEELRNISDARLVAVSPNGRLIAVANADSTSIFDLADGGLVHRIGHSEGMVQALAFTKDNSLLALGGRDGKVRVLHTNLGWSEMKGFEQPPGGVQSLAFSADGKTLAGGSASDALPYVYIWKTNVFGTPYRIWQTLDRRNGSVSQVVLSNDASRLALIGWRDEGWETGWTLWTEVWEVNQNNRILSLDNRPSALAFGPAGDLLATQRIDDASSVEVRTIGRQPDSVLGELDISPRATIKAEARAVVFNPSGDRLALASGDEVSVWGYAPARVVSLLDHPNVSILAYVEDDTGTRLITVSRDMAKVWRVNAGTAITEKLLSSAKPLADPAEILRPIPEICRRIGRNLTETEWDQLGFGEPDAPIICGALGAERETKARRLAASILIQAASGLATKGDITGATLKVQYAVELDPASRRLAAPILVQVARGLAAKGDIAGATLKFEEALTLDPALRFKPETEAKRLAASALTRVAQGLAAHNDITGATLKFEEALTLDPALRFKPETEAKRLAARAMAKRALRSAQRGDILEALDEMKQAQAYDPAVPITSEDWNTVCWFGSLYGRAADVLFDACEKASSLASALRLADSRDSRGLARALTGDVQGAIQDFTYYVEWTKAHETDHYAPYGKQRAQWVAALEAGQDPQRLFDEATLETLMDEKWWLDEDE